MKRILLIEDEEVFIKASRELLEAEGYEVIVSAEGKEGLNEARSSMPDLILLDVMLPGLDGFHIARMLKFDEKYKAIPIIMLTSKGADEDRLTASGCGADAYILKTEDPDVLLEKVREFLKIA